MALFDNTQNVFSGYSDIQFDGIMSPLIEINHILHPLQSNLT